MTIAGAFRPHKVDDPHMKNCVINRISGFYGLIGPDIDKKSVKTLYELFTGDGIIQGVFVDKGNITFVKHLMRTDKLLHEEKHGRFSNNLFMTGFYMIMNKLRLLPNVLGLANTAFLHMNNKNFVLFERDLPYEIDIDFVNKQLRTMKKVNIKGIDNFSGHSKFVGGNILHTIDYNFLTKTVSYMTLDDDFRQIQKVLLRTSYIPIIHDFVVLKNGMLFVDSPFMWRMFSSFPVVLSCSELSPSYVHVYDKDTNMTTKYECSNDANTMKPFTIFHYADIMENNDTIHIYGSQYEKLDFSSLVIQGKYRKMILNRKTGKVFVIKNAELENMNLDFPVKWKEYVLLRAIENQTIKGFVLCRGLNVVKKLVLPENRFFCGEPSVVEMSGSPFLIGFSYDSFENGYFVSLELFTERYFETPIMNDFELKIGFHSVFLSGK